MVYGILLLYKKEYAKKAIREFESLIKLIYRNSRVVIVTNNPEIKAINRELLIGIDFKSEFAGWQTGLESIGDISENDTIICANDTFCHSRPWGKFEIDTFSMAFKSISSGTFRGISGESCSFGENVELLGCKTESWISTYLFAVSGSLIKSLDSSLVLPKTKSASIFGGVTDGSISWTGAADSCLCYRINKWLDPNNKFGWYNKKADDDRLAIKVCAILNEIYLSAYAMANNFEVLDVYKFRGTMAAMFFAFRRRIKRLSQVINN